MRFVSPKPAARAPRHLAAPRGAWRLLLSLWSLLPLFDLPASAANALAGHPSPYLAMHGQDPVDWRPFGPEALAQARQENKPLFISSGYFACHWCHVMQRESYRNPGIAARLNRDFVPVKLDRELDPALDAYLIDFVERTAGQAGWPLNVFLTPDGYPMLGLTYAPADQFEGLLERVAGHWSQDSQSLRDLARRAAEERVRRRPDPDAGDAISAREMADRLRRQALLNADDLAGGFGRQARFPMAPTLTALLWLESLAPDGELEAFLRLTLDAMGDKGLRDHLGGGFFRYTVDPDWQTPHFEKMLYTQALLVPLYLRAAEVLDVPAYREIARDTLDFLLASMRGKDGAYIASLSAVDAAAVEGGYYLWSPEELRDLLDADEQRLVGQVFGMHGPVGTAGGYLPTGGQDPEQAAAALGLSLPAFERLRASAREKLLAARSQRELPRDDKALAGWNGLVLSALAAASDAFADDDHARAGAALAAYLRERLWDGRQLHRAVADSGWIGEATLEDYAFVAKGLRDWGRVSGDARDLALSRRLVASAWEAFYDGGLGTTGETPGDPGTRDTAPANAEAPAAPTPVEPRPGEFFQGPGWGAARGPGWGPGQEPGGVPGSRSHAGAADGSPAGGEGPVGGWPQGRPADAGDGGLDRSGTDPSAPGWRLWSRPVLPGVPAEPVLSDNPLPSPAATLLGLTLLDPDPALLPKARRALRHAHGPTARNPFVFASHAILYLEELDAAAAAPREARSDGPPPVPFSLRPQDPPPSGPLPGQGQPPSGRLPGD